MKAIVTNKLTVIKDPTPEIDVYLSKLLAYKDKAKEYTLRRMAQNPLAKRSQQYQDMKREVNGSLVYRLPDGNIALSSAFHYIIKDVVADIDDRRHETGKTIPLPWKNKPHDPRDYQEEALELLTTNYRGVVNFATGLGKSLVAVHAIKRYRKRALIVVPGDSIAKQFYSDLVDAFGESRVGMFGGGRKKIKDITVGIAASVKNHIDDFKRHDLGMIIMDECHHAPADTFYKIAMDLGDVGKIFGLTATDYRSDGKDIMIAGGVGPSIICKDIIWGVKNHWLADPYFIMRRVDTTDRYNYKNDKNKNYKSHVLNCQQMKDRIRSDVQKFMDAGKSVLCLVDEVAHGEELSRELGIPFATGKDKQSKQYIEQLNKNKIPGLVGTDGKIGEGVDTKNIEVLILANFVASKGPVIQCIGRGLRKTDTKSTCVILDYCPTGSDMMSRHASMRLKYYQEITDNVKVVE